MDDVEAHVAGPGAAHDRVQIRPVVVEGSARVAHHLGDLGDVLAEHAQRVRVGEHQAGDPLVELGAQILEVHSPPLVRRHLDHLVAGHRHRGGIGAVRGVRGEHPGAPSPRSSWYARVSSRPASSPWDPAEGWRLTCGRPQISARARSRRHISSRAPWARLGSCAGWRRAWPGNAATRSLSRGLCFIVQEPSGYGPVSRSKFRRERRL